MNPTETLQIHKTLTLTGPNARLGKALEIRRKAKGAGLQVSYRSHFVGMRRIFVLTVV